MVTPAGRSAGQTRSLTRGKKMKTFLNVAVLVLTLITACLGQETLVSVKSKGKQRWSPAEIDKIYLSACSALEQEFGDKGSVTPQVTLVLGADKNAVDFDKREVLLVKWDRDLFAQGVVVLAFEDLMTVQRRMTIARRAVNWADATTEVGQISK